MTAEEVVINGLAYNLTAPLEVREAGRRGRGVFATENIEKGTYLCATRVYHPKKRRKYESEYDKNGEGSYLWETQLGKKLIFDATRCYINHASIKTNCNYWRPLYIRGKYRVAFVATQPIEKGEELVYDYGKCDQSWMTAASPRRPQAPSKSFESYRRRRFCPVPGCTSKKPLKKLVCSASGYFTC